MSDQHGSLNKIGVSATGLLFLEAFSEIQRCSDTIRTALRLL